ncbi:MAG: hypothetical protein ACREOH_00955 [Candidatus Entotheonellia bacterium]
MPTSSQPTLDVRVDGRHGPADPAQLAAWARLWARLLGEGRVSPSKGEKNNSPAPADQADAGLMS